MQLSQGKLQILYSNEVSLEFLKLKLKLIIVMYVNEVWLLAEN
jgi:TctA family transporter